MDSLKAVCLISGGKDSLFSMLHCLANGHEVLALANLHPPLDNDGVEDMDSYMYQTVGHAVIPLYEKALELPLYRQQILGSAVNQSKSYGAAYGMAPDHADETESLVPLLRTVIAKHSDVNAVNTGAILSDYQRTRVESVAIRLGLTPLSYLWQWPNIPPHSQTSLLEDMNAVDQDARIIKVASGGLDDTFLWQNVADPHTIGRLERAAKRFGGSEDGAALGEGGEYETLAVAGPPPLWKGRIVVDEDGRRAVVGEAGSASVQVLTGRVQASPDTAGQPPDIRRPPLLEQRFQTILDDLEHNTNDRWIAARPSSDNERSEHPGPRNGAGTGATPIVPGHLLLSQLLGDGVTAADQTQSIMDQAAASLMASGHCLADVAYTSIFLRDMSDFAAINAVYGACFVHPNPPARVTIALAKVLPPEKHLMVSLTSIRVGAADKRKALHVQSRSYWAPANIGPYSQAISVPTGSEEDGAEGHLVFVSGQIPLVPTTMGLPTSSILGASDGFAYQAVLAQQHFERIGRAMQVKQWICAIAFIVAGSAEEAHARSSAARQAWAALHRSQQSDVETASEDADVDDSFDVWHVTHGSNKLPAYQSRLLDDRPARGVDPITAPPPLYVIQVDALPKGSSVEWVTYGLTTRHTAPDIPHLRNLLQVFRDHLVHG
ncbi:hypothetical protein LTR37_005146 [Vermiconidia calcicola]|uniref:Uncharacterized protein n=1 Tax=Vermiconidia calcicola TaxID=1690605 RepID=A0ACC3NLA0_9PEZI|nr:hypothetical protein LTR37_005146 [Vermiconidia calcicola]